MLTILASCLCKQRQTSFLWVTLLDAFYVYVKLVHYSIILLLKARLCLFIYGMLFSLDLLNFSFLGFCCIYRVKLSTLAQTCFIFTTTFRLWALTVFFRRAQRSLVSYSFIGMQLRRKIPFVCSLSMFFLLQWFTSCNKIFFWFCCYVKWK